MPNTTPNYNLTKPLETENYDVNIVNSNSDKIDVALKANADAISQLDADKVDAVVGKQLSDENYTLPEKNKVANLPADTAAQLAEKVQNFKIKNEVVNGDFSQGTTGWSTGGTSQNTANGNVLENMITTSNYDSAFVHQSFQLVLNKKYYLSVIAFVDTSQASRIDLVTYNPGQSVTLRRVLSPTQGVRYNLSGVLSATQNGTYAMRISHSYASGTLANGKKLSIEKPVLLDLTNVFGAGNEPTKLEMDELMKVIPNQWWDGELTLTQKQFITWQLNLIRKNTNAIIALGGTII